LRSIDDASPRRSPMPSKNDARIDFRDIWRDWVCKRI
jgi:hypothetical protein